MNQRPEAVILRKGVVSEGAGALPACIRKCAIHPLKSKRPERIKAAHLGSSFGAKRAGHRARRTMGRVRSVGHNKRLRGNEERTFKFIAMRIYRYLNVYV
jgi:hypothetical protein